MLEFLEIPVAFAASEESAGSLTSAISTIVSRIPGLAVAVIVIVLSFGIGRIAKNMVMSRIADQVEEEHEGIMILAGRATYVGVLALGFTIGLAIAGINITSLIAAVGFGISFAFKDLIMNFVAGVMILVARQFTIGDYINIDGVIGKIEEIQSRYTVLKALDGTRIVVPNSDLFSKQVISYTSNATRRIEVPVGVEYSTDLEKAVKVSLEALKTHPQVLKEPAPCVLLHEFGGSSINLLLRFWIESHVNWLNIRSDMIIYIKKAFDKAGIGIPFPIRTLYFANELEMKDEEKLSEAISKDREEDESGLATGG